VAVLADSKPDDHQEDIMTSSHSRTSIKARRVFAIFGLLAAGSLVASACSSGAHRSATAAQTASVSKAAPPIVAPPPTPARPASSPVTIAVGSSTLGPIAVDASGHSLYRYDKDIPGSGTSACNGACATAWPPALVSGPATAGPGVTGALGVATRADGTHQVTLDGHPLYRFSGDQNPGDTSGDGFGGIWHVVSARPAAVTSSSSQTAAAGY
jgi:predicted lipoprotein with Yx(FWY)xxD motif